MAASDQGQTEVVQSRADEKWVLLQDGGGAAKELLLEEQDGDASGEKKSLGNAAKGQESILDTAMFLGWCRSAWDDVHIHHALRDDIRPYAIGIALSVHSADVVATFETLKRHWRGTEEARTIFAKRWLHPPKPVLLTAACTVVCLLAIREIFMIFIVLGGRISCGVYGET
ncbi:hypothetical protein HPB51_023713 [Rhipicephalus microplus]|uniref:Uncharacterized protein n=1 Tax=Rhipicephalus microplus TaxID=6941 RepID=A0A9J6E3Y5_RHIMP|nr:hypothetical protein HPB51_023713 [Rhipicephalus microplus]